MLGTSDSWSQIASHYNYVCMYTVQTTDYGLAVCNICRYHVQCLFYDDHVADILLALLQSLCIKCLSLFIFLENTLPYTQLYVTSHFPFTAEKLLIQSSFCSAGSYK